MRPLWVALHYLLLLPLELTLSQAPRDVFVNVIAIGSCFSKLPVRDAMQLTMRQG